MSLHIKSVIKPSAERFMGILLSETIVALPALVFDCSNRISEQRMKLIQDHSHFFVH
jgi:hypothetical protein